MLYVWTFDAALFLSVLIHEFGHALMSMVLGVQIRKIRYGFGPILFRLGRFEMRIVPISGEVRTEEYMLAWKGCLIALAGMMMQWLVVVIAVWTKIARADVTFWSWMLGLAILSLLNLIPFGSTDGAVAVRWIKNHKKHIECALTAH